MLELASALLASFAAGRRVAVATVVVVDGSAPRALGTSMAVDDEGRVIGSISGGCVEGAVYEACSRVLDSGQPELCEFGFTDDDAFAVGLSCGGRLTVWVQELGLDGGRNAVPDALRTEFEHARDGRAAGVALARTDGGGPLELLTASAAPRAVAGTVVAPGGGGSGDAAVIAGGIDVRLSAREHERERERVREELRASIHSGRSVRRRVECDGAVIDAVLLVSAAPARMIVFGAVDFSAALSKAAALLGYRVTVCDARPVFATPERFPHADVVNQWPTDYLAGTEVDERTVLCILTHDDKFDVPLIEAALALPVAYVGAMGSRATHDRRMAKLRERGVDEGVLVSLHSPIGLDLGASSPEETAVSILAEILAVRNGASARSLRATRGAIHTPRHESAPIGGGA